MAEEQPKEKTGPIYRSLLARNIKAFLDVKGQHINPEATPEYMTNGAVMLKKTYGADLAAYMCRQDDTKRFNRWVKGLDLPQAYEAVGLLASIEVTEILLGKFVPTRAKEWMLTPCSYILDSLPMDFIREDPDLVRRAALQIFL